MTSDVDTPVVVKDKVAAGKPPPSTLSRLARPALVVAACALLAGGGYYAWQTWVSPDSSASTLLAAESALKQRYPPLV